MCDVFVYAGRDSTLAFTGTTGVYRHSAAATNLLGRYRIATLLLVDTAATKQQVSEHSDADEQQQQHGAARTLSAHDDDDIKLQHSPEPQHRRTSHSHEPSIIPARS